MYIRIMLKHSFSTSHCGQAGRPHAWLKLVSIPFGALVALQPILPVFCLFPLFFLSHLSCVAAHSVYRRAGSLPLQTPAFSLTCLSGCGGAGAHLNTYPERNIMQNESWRIKQPTIHHETNAYTWERRGVQFTDTISSISVSLWNGYLETGICFLPRLPFC